MTTFSLIKISDVRDKFPFLISYDGFDMYDDWNNEDYFLVADDNAEINGNFCIDVYDKKGEVLRLVDLFGQKVLKDVRIEGIVIIGDLKVDGCIINAEGDYGPFFYVGGNIFCQSLLLGGAYAVAKGNVIAREVVMNFYNHGNFICDQCTESPVFIVNDHYTNYNKKQVSTFYYNDREKDHPHENECSFEDDQEVISTALRKHLNNSLTTSFEELKRDLENGEPVLSLNAPEARGYDYWLKKVKTNYRDLKRVPLQFKDQALCMMALNETFYALQYFPATYITKDLCRSLVEKDGFALKVIPDRFITSELCWLAAKKGVILSIIPPVFRTADLVLEVFRNSSFQPDIEFVPDEFLTEDFIVEYVKIGKAVWLDKCCAKGHVSKSIVLKRVVESGFEYVDNLFASHCCEEVFRIAESLYNQDPFVEKWNALKEKYHKKLRSRNLL